MPGSDKFKALLLTPLARIPAIGGDVLHAMKKTSKGFEGFGEAYMSEIRHGMVKGWKMHKRMTLNLIVIQGEIRFCVADSSNNVVGFNLSPTRLETHQRLTLYPGYWLAFGGVSEGNNVLLNIADIEHDPEETESCILAQLPWSW